MFPVTVGQLRARLALRKINSDQIVRPNPDTMKAYNTQSVPISITLLRALSNRCRRLYLEWPTTVRRNSSRIGGTVIAAAKSSHRT